MQTCSKGCSVWIHVCQTFNKCTSARQNGNKTNQFFTRTKKCTCLEAPKDPLPGLDHTCPCRSSDVGYNCIHCIIPCPLSHCTSVKISPFKTKATHAQTQLILPTEMSTMYIICPSTNIENIGTQGMQEFFF